MNPKLQTLTQRILSALRQLGGRTASAARHTAHTTVDLGTRHGGAAVGGVWRHRGTLVTLALLGGAGYGLYTHPPFETVDSGEVGVRHNQITGSLTEVRDGAVLVIPGVHRLRRYSLREQIYRPEGAGNADGSAPFQTVEGLAIGVDIAVRYALDPSRIDSIARNLPDDVGGQVIEPATQAVLYRTLARYSVREIFSAKRPDIQQQIESELKPLLAADGIRLQAVMIGKVDLPTHFKTGMEKLLAEELATEQMRFTLERKDKEVKQSELEAQAEKVRRETAAEAAGAEQVIAAKAQAEAMKHVLPFKQKQIEQRQLEAEADKIARIKAAEASSQARQIEATGEAESRRKLADAEGYRQEKLGKISSEQLARDGALIQKNPLLIQKAMADKLSDKISVIIAPPPADGSFIGAALLGSGKAGAATANTATTAQAAAPSAQGSDTEEQ